MYNPVSKIDELFPDFAELDQTVAEMQERQNQIITDFNFIIRQVAETAKKSTEAAVLPEESPEPELPDSDMPLTQFLAEFGDSLFNAVTEQNQPVYQGQTYPHLEKVLDNLERPLFAAQREVVRAVLQQLVVEDKPAAIINAEMGTGKTMMSIAAAAATHQAGLYRTLVLSPPHLVYKWRREILKTVPNARVWILNGADTLAKLLQIRALDRKPEVPEFFVMGRVRMRMDYHWRPSYAVRRRWIPSEGASKGFAVSEYYCPKCGCEILDEENKPYNTEGGLKNALAKNRRFCKGNHHGKPCKEPLWTLCRKEQSEDGVISTVYDRVLKTMTILPGIGPKTAAKIIGMYGEQYLAEILENNIQAFSNLMDENGEFLFDDRQAARIDRDLGKAEFSLGRGGYQPTEFIKRYLPKNFFGLLVVDEGHEYKNYGTAQGQAMGVLARCCNKILCLTGTLMGGYAEDLFFLLWRLWPQMMIEDGFGYNKGNTLGSASMAFMRKHGVLKDIVRHLGTEYSNGAFSSSKAERNSIRTAKAPGFSPLGIMRYVLPITVFLKLRDLGEGVLPGYKEVFRPVEMTEDQQAVYKNMESVLRQHLKVALRNRDNTLTGVVMSALLSWPDCCYKPQDVYWRRQDKILFHTEPQFDEEEISPKEADMLEVVKDSLAKGRKCLVYTVYTDTRDTTGRLKEIFKRHGIKAAVMKATVKADQREDWVEDRLAEGVQVVICNPELVKTGLDLLAFPTIYFLQTGYNVYTLMQAARRSWRIGQKEDVEVYFAGYSDTAQQICLELMGQKVAVTQSTSGDMPDSGLDILNQAEDSVEVQLAKRLVEQQD
ncbi:DEAD/DEAH box helicase family protein [Neisseria subflava]|uniref:SNF2-related protein n=1 Tax=Neisseria subflava TaxID=28449 RepID=UPI001C9A2220|nr:SNF2-related protein [Neisseria subflava]MBY6286911.1 DEAD/DEAH box helicase family protein [Neisseria subflava]